jgi:hypothetical protein
MNDEEIMDTYQKLRYILTENNLYWVVEQVEEAIQRGKLEELQTQRVKESDLRNPQLMQSRRNTEGSTSVTTVVEYTSSEKLQMLIEAVQQAIINSSAMENSILDFFQQRTDNITSYRFSSIDADATINKDFSVSQNSKITIEDNIVNLNNSLENLKEEIK